jgi:hypothetical protein
MESNRDILSTSAYPKEAVDELQKPYMEAYNALAFYNLYPKTTLDHAEVNCDWEQEYMITEEGKNKDLRNNLVNQHLQNAKREISREQEQIMREDIENQEKAMERELVLNTLLQLANEQESNNSVYEDTYSYNPPTNQQEYKPKSTYVPHYTKPWTNSDLAKVGAYSTKQSTADKVYQQCYAKQDRAWQASIKSQIKWKK